MTARRIHAFAFAFSIGAATPAAADTLRWYVSAKTSIAEHRLTEATHYGSIGDGTTYGGQLDGQLAATHNEDETGGIGFSVGRSFNAWRVEGELMWRYRTDWDLRALTHSIGSVTNLFTNIETTTLMINAIRSQQLNEAWRWEIGTGVGLVRTSSEASFVERGTVTRAEFIDRSHHDQTQFAWGALLGVSRSIGERWRMDLHYRYLDLGDIAVGPFPTRSAQAEAEHTAHELQVSFTRGM